MSAVISAFPATGKTFVAGRDHRFVDSDSSRFSWSSPGVRHGDWPGNYVEHIQATIAAGGHLLVSTHLEVREALATHRIPFTLVYPTVDQREEYCERMKQRGSTEALISRVIDELWAGALASCILQEGCEHVVLRPGQYLVDVLPRIVASHGSQG